VKAFASAAYKALISTPYRITTPTPIRQTMLENVLARHKLENNYC
jgi:hypothetical protein